MCLSLERQEYRGQLLWRMGDCSISTMPQEHQTSSIRQQSYTIQGNITSELRFLGSQKEPQAMYGLPFSECERTVLQLPVDEEVGHDMPDM